MFKPQMSLRGIHPYQTTMVPRSEQQFATASEQRVKYPWAEEIVPVYQTGTDSSVSDSAYQVPYYHTREVRPPSPGYQLPYSTGAWRNSIRKGQDIQTLRRNQCQTDYVFPECSSAFSLPLCDVDTCARTQHVDCISVPPASPEVPIVGACGGHCPGFEYVCYYILQVIFVVGILTGISLCIAGIVLRRTNKNGDLGVLVYIGCLSSSVCGVLLGVQGCVRRELRTRRRRALTHIPLQHLPEVPATACPLVMTTLPRNNTYRQVYLLIKIYPGSILYSYQLVDNIMSYLCQIFVNFLASM